MTTETFKGSKPTITKDPDATLDYSWDWTAWLALISDTIASHVITPETPLVVASHSDDGKIVTAYVSGGSAGMTHSLACKIMTVGGRIDERTVYLKIQER